MSTISAQSIVIDHGYKEFLHNLKTLDGAFTKVGLPAKGHTTGRYSMAELANVADINEFGKGKVPERSFMRSATDENRKTILEASYGAVMSILFSPTGTMGASVSVVRHFVGEVGQKLALMMKQKLQDGPFMANKPRTVERKGHDMPLVETGQLFESIQERTTVGGRTGFSTDKMSEAELG